MVYGAFRNRGRRGQPAAEDVVDAHGRVVGRERHPRGVGKYPEAAAQPREHRRGIPCVEIPGQQHRFAACVGGLQDQGQRCVPVFGRERKVGDAYRVVREFRHEQYPGLFAPRERDAAYGERLGARQQPDAVASAREADGAAERGVHTRHPPQFTGDVTPVRAQRGAVQFLQRHQVGRFAQDDPGDAADVLYVVDADAVADVVGHQFETLGPLCAGGSQAAADGQHEGA